MKLKVQIFKAEMNLQDEFTRNNFGSNFPTSLELLQRTSYLFVNMNELLDIARPTSPKMKFIGGIAAAQQPSVSANSKHLDCDVQQIFGIFLNRRKNKFAKANFYLFSHEFKNYIENSLIL